MSLLDHIVWINTQLLRRQRGLAEEVVPNQFARQLGHGWRVTGQIRL
jgi:hypothetical protein